MKTENFSQTQLEHIMTSISANKRQIDKLEVENEAKYNELDTFIQHKLISLNWKPKYNEKVINIALAAQIESIIPFRIYADRHKDFRW